MFGAKVMGWQNLYCSVGINVSLNGLIVQVVNWVSGTLAEWVLSLTTVSTLSLLSLSRHSAIVPAQQSSGNTKRAKYSLSQPRHLKGRLAFFVYRGVEEDHSILFFLGQLLLGLVTTTTQNDSSLHNGERERERERVSTTRTQTVESSEANLILGEVPMPSPLRPLLH